MVLDSVSEKFGIKKSIGFGFDKIRYKKKYWIRYRKNLVSEKSFGFGFVQILGIVTHWPEGHKVSSGAQPHAMQPLGQGVSSSGPHLILLTGWAFLLCILKLAVTVTTAKNITMTLIFQCVMFSRTEALSVQWVYSGRKKTTEITQSLVETSKLSCMYCVCSQLLIMLL